MEIPDDLIEVITAKESVSLGRLATPLRYQTNRIACILLCSCPHERVFYGRIEASSTCDMCFASRDKLTAQESLSNLVAYITMDRFCEMWALRTNGGFVPTQPTEPRRDSIVEKLLHTYQWCKEEDARLAANQNPEETE